MRENSEFLQQMLRGEGENFESAIAHYLKTINIL